MAASRGVPIPPDYTHAQWLDDYLSYNMADFIDMLDKFKKYVPAEIRYPAALDVHKVMLKHFFENDPEGAQKGLKDMVMMLGLENTLDNRGFAESGGAVGQIPYIAEYLKYGASMKPLRAYIESLPDRVPEDVNKNWELSEYKAQSEFKKVLKKFLEDEIAANRNLPPLPPSPPNSNNNQGGGRRRKGSKSRKLLRKSRRATRRRNSRRNY